MNLIDQTEKGSRILITDDDPDQLFVTARILNKAGYDVDQALSGEEALEKASIFKPDLMLLDVVMPDPDGFEVCRRIKSVPHLKDISIVFLSNHSHTPLDKSQGLDAGADDYIARPYNSTEFLSRIKSILRVKTIENRLREQQKWMQVTLSSIGDGLITTDHNERIVFMNPVAESLTGWSNADAQGQNFEAVFNIIDEHNHTPVESPIRHALKHQAIFHLKDNVSLVAKDKRILSIADSAAPIKGTDNTIVGGVLVFRDITKKKQTEQRLEQATENWEALFKAIGHVTLIMDGNHTIMNANDMALETLGMTRAEIIGKKCFQLLHNENAPPPHCPMVKTLKTRQQEASPQHFKNMEGDFLVSCTPILDANGDIEKVIHISTDITEFTRIKNERRELEDHLRHAQKLEAIGTLAGGIAHDFNNILSSIIGFTELSLEMTEDNPSLHDYLEEVYTAGKRARELVKQILTFARQTRGQMQQVQLGPIVKEVIRFLRASVPATVDIAHTISTDACIQADPTRIHQVLMNLCTNAVQAMEEEGGRLHVSVDLEQPESTLLKFLPTAINNECVKLTVTDTGSGIPDAIQASVFEPYFTTKASKEGTGLGLSTVHGIVKDCNGHITFKSSPGQGTQFVVYLPTIPAKQVPGDESHPDLPRGTEHILLVDDELPIAKMGSRMLTTLGYAVTTQTDSLAALNRFKSGPDDFDLIITDMTMPNLTGDRLAMEIKKIRSDIPVVLCTGFSKRVSIEAIQTMGIDAMFFKPILHANLAKNVRQVLDKTHKCDNKKQIQP